MMPLLSVRAKLSTRYTNHCVRASVVTDLKDAGFSNHEVCSITGHKRESSLQHYDQVGSSRRPTDMADVLDGNPPPAKKPCTEVRLQAQNAQLDEQQLTSAHLARNLHLQPTDPTIGGISLTGNAVIHNLTISFTRPQPETTVSEQLELNQVT